MIFVTPNRESLIVPYRAELHNCIPSSKSIIHHGNKYLVIPNHSDAAKLGRNLGIDIPAPILTRYDWRGFKPWEVQKTTTALLSESMRAYVLNAMGTGKTLSAIWAADYLLQNKVVDHVLVAAPLSILTPVWEQELFKVNPRAKVRVLHGSKAKRRSLLQEDAEWFIINHHGLPLLAEEIATRGVGIFIIDELAVFRNKSTNLWRAAYNIIRSPSIKYVWGMTGSPTPNAPTDAWAQVRLLTPERTVRTMLRFRDMTMVQLSQFKWAPKPEANDIVQGAMQPSVRFALEDVVELPETSYVDRPVVLEPLALSAYKKLVAQMTMTIKSGDTITALNEGVLQNKLLQVACGYIYTDTEKVYQLPNKSRLDALSEIVGETDRKVIVFVPYIHALQGIADYLKKHGHTVELVYGGTSHKDRNRIFAAFQNEAAPRILVAHPQCMAHGLNLTIANTIVWYAPVNSLEIYEQANARIKRPGQKHKTLVVHLLGTNVEKETYARLRSRSKMQGLLLELFKNQKLNF